MSEQRCGTCKFYNKERDAIGLCRHPITQLMRHLYQEGMVPFAFSELEVTTLMPNAGTDCPTYEAQP